MSNHVMYDRGARFLRVIISSSCALCCLPLVRKQEHDFQVFFVPLTVVTIFFFVQCIKKQSLDSFFVISRIIKVSVRVISLSLRLWLRLITATSTLSILDITKTSSNNCLMSLRPPCPCIWRPASPSHTSRVPYLMSPSPSSCVPRSQVPTLAYESQCPRSLAPVPVPVLYTATNLW